jgi:hypothetical protein
MILKFQNFIVKLFIIVNKVTINNLDQWFLCEKYIDKKSDFSANGTYL